MAVVCAVLGIGGALVTSCLDRPVVTTEPQTSNIFVDLTAQRTVDKIDLLFMIDNSASMSDKQEMLKLAVPQLLGRLINPICHDAAGVSAPMNGGACPAGFEPEFDPVDDIHIGVISSSLGSPHAAACAPETVEHGDDAGHLIGLARTRADGTPLQTYQGLGFLAWDPKGKKAAQGLAPGESDPNALIRNFQELVVATDETGCGYEASLEAWYRFLVDPMPPAAWVVENDVARPEGVDTELLEQRRQFLRPDSLVAIVMLSDENDCSLDFRGDGWYLAYNGEDKPGSTWTMPRAVSACEADPLGPCCRPCGPEPNGPPSGCMPSADDPACAEGDRHSTATDPRNLRCFDQQRRFGVSRLFPINRYVDALKKPTVLAYDGSEHPNPLFTNLATGTVASRTSDLVFLAGIVGVPWQDVATADSLGAGSDRTLRYQDAASLRAGNVWSLILGDPSKNERSADPLMHESIEPRQGAAPSGLALAPPESGPMQNPVNGHEYYPRGDADLQYACIFPLEPPAACDDNDCDCSDSSETLTPLCQQSSGAYGDTQVYAKAYPGLRQLQVLQGVGDSGIVASICPKLLPAADTMATLDPNVGYNPAVEAILKQIGTKLGGKCVPRQLAPDPVTHRVPCAMVEVLPRDEQGQCQPCSTVPGRTDPEAAISRSVKKELVSAERCRDASCPEVCLCEIEQATGDELGACQNDASANAPGYCYIDGAIPVGNPALVQDCPGERGLRFVGDDTPRNGAQTFIACVGAPFGDVATP